MRPKRSPATPWWASLGRAWGAGLLTRIEAPAGRYSGRGEAAVAVAGMLCAFLYKLMDSLTGKNAVPGEPMAYILLLSLFTAVAFSSVLWLATPVGERWVRRMLDSSRISYLAALPPLYVGVYLSLLWLLGLPELHTHALQAAASAVPSLPLPVFLLFTAVILFTGFRAGLKLTLRLSTLGKKSSGYVFGWRLLGCVLLASLPYLLLQELVPLLWCFSTPVAVLVLVYGSRLGREYFAYSFVPRSLKEACFVLVLLIAGLFIFLAFAALVGAVAYTGALWRTSGLLLFDAVFMNLFVVGISEEVIFRSTLLTLGTAQFAVHRPFPRFAAWPRTSSLLVIAVLFGLSHFPHGALLTFLAFWASLLYGLAFVVGKSLFGPVLLHGLLNVLILMNFRLDGFS